MVNFKVGDVVRPKGDGPMLTVIGSGEFAVVLGFDNSGKPFYVTAPHAAFIATEADDEVY